MSKKILNIIICMTVLIAATTFGSDICRAETATNDIYKTFNGTDSVVIDDAEIYSQTNGYVYVLYKASADGYIHLSFDKNAESQNDFRGYVWICDGRKNLYSSGNYISSSITNTDYQNLYFGVQKDKNYYIKIKIDRAGCKIDLTENAVARKAGNTSKKAVSLAQNTPKEGFVPAGNNRNDYYKIVLKKNSMIDFSFLGNTNGSIYFQITRSGYYTGKFYANYPMNGTEQTVVSKKLKAGIYIVKVAAKNSTSSGYYRIQWKTHSTN